MAQEVANNTNTTIRTNSSQETGNPVTGNVTPEQFFIAVLLKMFRVSTDTFKHLKYAKKSKVVKGHDYVNWRRYNPLNTVTTPLTEGQLNGPAKTGVVVITASTKQYGNYMEFTDVVDFAILDNVQKEYLGELSINALESMDAIARNTCIKESSRFFPNGKTATTALDAGDKPSIIDLRVMALSLKVSGRRPIVGKRYVHLCSSAMMNDYIDDVAVKNYQDFGNTNKYIAEQADMLRLYDVQIEEALNTHIIPAGKTSIASETAPASFNVHQGLFYSLDCFGSVEITNYSGVQILVKALGSAGTADPLNQKQSIGWKINSFGVRVIDNAGIYTYSCVPTNHEQYYSLTDSTIQAYEAA